MLTDLVYALMTAKTDKEKELAYNRLSKVGVDRVTANVIVHSLKDIVEEDSNETN